MSLKVKLCIILMMLSPVIWAQRQIRGLVLDQQTKEVLVGAHVYLVSNWQVGTTTEANGKFLLTLPHKSTASQMDSLIISYLGYAELKVSLADVKVEDHYQLESTSELWKEVVITAKPLIAEEFKYLKIQKMEIYTNPAAKADPILAVNSLPAATTVDESANISLRGSSPQETGVLLNGVPLYEAVRYTQLNGIGTFSLFNTAIIKEVTVFPSNPPIEYGNVSSGAIAITTDEDLVDESVNSAIVSLANVGYSRSQKISSNQSLKIFANYQPSQLIKSLNEKSLREIESFQSGDLGLYYYGTKGAVRWKLLNYHLIEGYEFNLRHPSYNGVFDQNKYRSFATFSLEHQAGKGSWSLNLGGSFQDAGFSYASTGINQESWDGYAAAHYSIKSQKLQIKSGISLDYRHQKSSGTKNLLSYAWGPEHPTIDIAGIDEVSVLEGYSYLKYFHSDNWVIGLGLRKNLPNEEVADYLSKQINVSYQKHPWTITIGTGHYHKLGLDQRRGGLFSSESKQLALDTKYEQGNLTLGGSLYAKSISGPQQVDIRGAEIFVVGQMGARWRGNGSLSWLHTDLQESQLYPFDLNFFLKGNLAYRSLNAWTLEANLLLRDGTPVEYLKAESFDDDLQVFVPTVHAISRLPHYFALGLAVSKLFSVSDELALVAFASINNLTDHQNVRSYQYSFDYTQRNASFFSLRTGYFGVVLNF